MAFDFDKFRADMLARIDLQHPTGRDGRYDREADAAALNMLCGAAMALDQLDPAASSRMVGWAFLVSVRGLSDFLSLGTEKREAA